jgi:hypothetical protein
VKGVEQLFDVRPDHGELEVTPPQKSARGNRHDFLQTRLSSRLHADYPANQEVSARRQG